MERGLTRHFQLYPFITIAAMHHIGEITMFDVEFLSPADREFAALPESTRNEILTAVRALAADGRAATTNLGFAVARAAGQVAVCQTDDYLEGIQVLLLVDEKLWDEGAKAASDAQDVKVERIVWPAHPAAMRDARLNSAELASLEEAIVRELVDMGMAEVAALAVGFGSWVAVCDLDSHGTASVLTLLPLTEYSALVDDEETELFMGLPVTVLDGIRTTRH
jgi:hypothetical protein